MKAMILAAGLGSRLKEMTQHCPKALVEAGGITLLERCIEKLKSYQVNDFVINIHHFGEQIIQFVEQKHYFDVNIQFSDERTLLLDTGGGIKHARKFLDNGEPFIVHNVDIISDLDIRKMYDFHCQQQALATLAVRERTTKRFFLFDNNNQLCGKVNLNTNERLIVKNKEDKNLKPLAFSGIHVISPKIFSLFPTEEKFSITAFYEQIAEKEKILAYQHQEGMWMDMGKIEDFQKLEQMIKKQ